ncbi:hypothetical protein C9374_011253 [Naegleria lovaniensis]|uniref:Uncharacterized protein n=1 Tax=Naegleria lovaniensis TaxID=51637 RepID=A0AA88KNU8_NAELO|nr:uncharacterized protein C9374_011253 [Naegleria lovaniensis]KAG2392528.1 hypothetical protein C9374_011253 [Naegleria lovaniensis]
MKRSQSINTVLSFDQLNEQLKNEIKYIEDFLSLAEKCKDLRPILPIHATFYRNQSRVPSFWIQTEEERYRKKLEISSNPQSNLNNGSSSAAIPNPNLSSSPPSTENKSHPSSPQATANSPSSPSMMVMNNNLFMNNNSHSNSTTHNNSSINTSSQPHGNSLHAPHSRSVSASKNSVWKLRHQQYHNRFMSEASDVSGDPSLTSYVGLNSNFSPNVSVTSMHYTQFIPNFEIVDKQRLYESKLAQDVDVIELDENWSLYRDIKILNDQLDSITGKFNTDEDKEIPSSNIEEFENALVAEMTKRLEIAQVLRDHQQYSEAYAHLCCVEQLAINNQHCKFVPKIDLLHAKALFLKSLLLRQKKKNDDANDFLQSAQEKTDALLKAIAPSEYICNNSPSFIVLSTRILHAEILLCLAEEMMSSSAMAEFTKPTYSNCEMTVNEKKYFCKVLSTFLVPALDDLRTLTSTRALSVLNVHVFLIIIYNLALCMRALNEISLAKRLLHLKKRLRSEQFLLSSSEALPVMEDEENGGDDFERDQLETETMDKMEKLLKEIDQMEKTNNEEKPKQHSWEEDSDDTSSGSDWGNDFNFDDAPKSSLAGFLFGEEKEDTDSANEDVFEEELFPNKYRLFKSRTYKEDSMLPELVLSKNLINGKPGFNDKREMLMWCQSLKPKKLKDQTVIDSCTRDDYANFLLGRLEKRVQKYDFSMEFIENFYEICYRLINLGKQPLTTKSILTKFFENLSTDIINKMAPNERAYVFHVSIDLLKAAHATKLFNLEEPTQSQEFTDLISLLFHHFPHQRAILIVLQCEIQIKYHISQLLNGILPEYESIGEVFTTMAMIFNEVFDITEEAMEKNDLFYQQVDTKLKDEPLVTGITSTASNSFNSPYFSFPTPSEIGAKIVIYLEMYDLSLRRHAGSETWIPHFRHPLLNSQERIAIMFSKFYNRMCISKEKAVVAYTLGSCWMQKDDMDLSKLAECVLFESVYVFQKSPPLCSALPTIITADALRAMQKFGDVLYANRKYPYAAIIFEIYTQNYRLLASEFDYKFIDELAAMAVKNDDWNRSIRYYTILNEKACRDKRVAVIANISSKLSSLFMEKGELRNAERVKRDALETIKSLSSSTEFKLELEVDYAKLLLNGGNLERCISICFNLMQSFINIKNPELYITIAEAYLKKRWYKECDKVLRELALIMESNFMQLQQQQEMRILEIVIKYYRKRSLFGNAIESVNMALYRCNRTFSTLAQLFKLKAKIFMGVARWCNPVNFPNELAPKDKERLPILVQIQKSEVLRDAPNESYLYSKRPIYNLKDVIVDAIDCLQKAKKYYEACSNEINLAKMDLLISQVLVEYLFLPVAVMSKRPEDYVYLDTKDSISKFNYIDLNKVFDDYIEPTLNVAVTASDIFLCMDVALTAAECRLLQGRTQSAKKYWCEMRDILFTLFVDNNLQVVVASGATPSTVEKLLNLINRCARLLLSFEPTFINSNIGVFDTLYIITLEYDQVLKRTQEPTSLSVDQIDSKATKISSFIDTELLDKNKPFEGLYKVNAPSSAMPVSLKSFSFSSMLRSPTSPFKSVIENNILQNEMKEDSQRSQLRHKVIERLFYCLLSMKYDRRKYPGEIDGQLRFKNQQSMRRLYNLMNAVRESKLSGHKRKSFYNSLSNDSTKTTNSSIDFLDATNLTLLPGDKLVVESLLSTFNETKGIMISGTLKTTMNLQLEGNLQKQASLAPCLTPLKQALKKIKKSKALERLVLLLHLDNIICCYIPNTLQKSFVQFGGRQMLDSMSESTSTSQIHQVDSTVLSWSKMLGSLSNTIMSKAQDPAASEYNINQYIKDLIIESMRDKKDRIMNKANLSLLRQHFSMFREAFKYKPDPVAFSENVELMKKLGLVNFNYASSINQKTGTFTKKKTMGMPRPEILPLPSTPISLLVPNSLQAIPWELLFEENVLRYFSMHNIFTRNKKKAATEIGGFIPKVKRYPKFFSFYSNDDPKFIEPMEDDRKNFIAQHVVSEKLHLKATSEARENEDVRMNIPFHIPIVKYGKKPSSKSYKKKYEPVEFLRLSKVLSDTPRFVRIVESKLQDDQYPVFLFSWADLVDLCPLHLYISHHVQGAMMIFVPDGCYRKFTEFLMVLYEFYWSGMNAMAESPQNKEPTTSSVLEVNSSSAATGTSTTMNEEYKLRKFLLLCASVLKNEKEYSMPFVMLP